MFDRYIQKVKKKNKDRARKYERKEDKNSRESVIQTEGIAYREGSLSDS
jgi:hypothetical protein